MSWTAHIRKGHFGCAADQTTCMNYHGLSPTGAMILVSEVFAVTSNASIPSPGRYRLDGVTLRFSRDV
jgi:hypothetical protein